MHRPYAKLLILSMVALLAPLAAQAEELAAAKPSNTAKPNNTAKPSHAAKPNHCLEQRECIEYPRAQDEVWHINSRCLCYSDIESNPDAVKQLAYTRRGKDQWHEATFSQYVAAESKTTRTVYWIHGFRTEAYQADMVGDMMLRSLVDADTDPAPLRLVIWSWPSGKTRGVRLQQNARIRACRSDTEGLLLASLVNRSTTKRPVSVIGYSLGARAMFSAFHLLAGGDVDGNQIEVTPIVRKIPMRGTTVAAAVHSYWLDAGQRYSKAIRRSDHTSILYNPCDRVLGWYPKVFGRNRRCGPQALGAIGLYTDDLAPEIRQSIEQFNACCYVRKEHRVRDYLLYFDLVEKMQQGVFGRSD